MPCYHPLRAWRGKVGKSGKRSVVFKRGESTPALLPFDLKLPCGQCIGCRLERSRQWAMRCVNEAQMHKENAFISLTYDEGHLPSSGSLVLRDFQLFMKRLRFFVSPKVIRFFHCGEYGELYHRPHYHCLVFGHGFNDRVYLKSTGSGSKIYRSASLESLWTVGYSSVGDVTFESAAYVARYVLKKVMGEGAIDHYVNKVSGEVLSPEYVTMSRRPGIGKLWYDKFKLDVYPSDFLIYRGMKMKPPKYYDGLYELEDPDGIRAVRSRRVALANRLVDGFDDNDGIRLPVKEEVKCAQVSLLCRKLESGQL